MISIHLYGKLRKYAPDPTPSGDSVLYLEPVENDTLDKVLQRAGLDIAEIYTIFLNAKLLTTHNRMAALLAYPQVQSDCHNWDLSIPIRAGDRLGLFGSDMPALVV